MFVRYYERIHFKELNKMLQKFSKYLLVIIIVILSSSEKMRMNEREIRD